MPTLYYPFPVSTVTEWPGQRPGSYHVGTDFGIAQGTPLRATADGTVSRWTDQYGAYIVDIKTSDGWTIRNGHLSRIDVVNGQQVKIGQIIGLTGGIPGTPGAGWSTGAHLHWELRNAGGWVDPRSLNPQPKTFDGSPPLVYETEKFMRIALATDGKAYLATDDGFYHLPSPMYYDLFVRLINSNPNAPDKFTPAEIDAMNGSLQDLARRNAGSFSGTVTAQVDYAKIAKTVLDEEAKRLQS